MLCTSTSFSYVLLTTINVSHGNTSTYGEKNSFVKEASQTVNTPKKTVQKTTIDLTQEEYEFLKRQKEENGITTRWDYSYVVT